jgi:hypothetical protein
VASWHKRAWEKGGRIIGKKMIDRSIQGKKERLMD